MTDLTKRILVQYGLHPGAVDFSDPSSSVFLEPEGEWVPGGDYEYVERNFQRTEYLTAVQGAKSASLPDVTFPLYGQGGGGSGDGVSSGAAGTVSCLDDLLTMAFGEEGTLTGADLSASDSGSGTTLTMADAAAGGSVEEAFLFATATEGWNVARTIVASSGSNYTLDRAPVQRDGSADTGNEGAVAYASRTYVYRNDSHSRALLQFDVEGENWRRVFDGVCGNVTFNFPDGGIATVTMSNVVCHDWQDTAEASPSYSAPTRGSNIVCIDSPFYIGSTLYIAHNISLDLALEISPRPSTGGLNGRVGYVIKGGRPRLTATLLAGTLTGPTEVTDATLATLQGNTAQDISFQAGQDPGAACYIHMPDADCRATRTSVDGLDAIQLEAFATEEATYSNLDHCLYFHLF